jgi:hypothetical protein
MTAGPAAETLSWATEIAAAASERMGREVSLWAAGFGAPVGAMAFTARVDGLADLAATTASMQTDASYQALVARGATFSVAPPQDSLATPMMGELGDPPPVGAYALITNSVMAGGKFAEAVSWATEMAQLATSITGMPVGLMMQQYGTFGQLTWIGVSADAAGIDASGAAIAGNADYIDKLAGAADLFVPGSATRSLATRLA